MDFDDATLHVLKVRAKKQIRERMRALRRAIPEGARAKRAERIRERVASHPAYAKARTLGLFWPIMEHGEVDLRPLDDRARGEGKAVYYPFVEVSESGAAVGFRRLDDPQSLSEGNGRFCQPPTSAPEAEPGQIDLVVVPALAVAETGHRLGYGSGFYDQVLAHFCPPAASLAVAYSFQLLAELPVEPHDVACDFVVTDERSIEVRPAGDPG